MKKLVLSYRGQKKVAFELENVFLHHAVAVIIGLHQLVSGGVLCDYLFYSI